MTREELLTQAKPILFNTEMVKAILEGRKTVTRRCVKYKYSNTEMKMHTDKYGTRLIEIQKNVEGETHGRYPDGRTWQKLLPYIEKKPPFKKGDYLYVRETFSPVHIKPRRYLYKVGCEEANNLPIKWHPSIHMPKEATRLFLKVTDVRVERLQDITNKEAKREGVVAETDNSGIMHKVLFIDLWNSTIKKADLDTYGWGSNPWIWVIEFERVEV